MPSHTEVPSAVTTDAAESFDGVYAVRGPLHVLPLVLTACSIRPPTPKLDQTPSRMSTRPQRRRPWL